MLFLVLAFCILLAIVAFFKFDQLVSNYDRSLERIGIKQGSVLRRVLPALTLWYFILFALALAVTCVYFIFTG